MSARTKVHLLLGFLVCLNVTVYSARVLHKALA